MGKKESEKACVAPTAVMTPCTSASAQKSAPPLPKSLADLAEEARTAISMESALLGNDQRLQTLLRKNRVEKELHAQRHRKANTYTLAEKYNLLDIFPPTVIITDTKPA